MKAQKYWILTGILVMCLVVICVASTLTDEQQALQGIKEVHVDVVLTDDTVKTGLLKSQVQTDVELKLRREGIKVLPQKEYGPILRITVAAIPIKSNQSPPQILSYACSVLFALDEHVRIIRSDTIVSATTWSRIGVVHAPPDIFSNYIRGHISDSIDEFLNEYLAANPKEQPEKEADGISKFSPDDRWLATGGVGPIPESLIQKMYQFYIAGEGKDLIKMTNEQLSKHIVNIKDNNSIISYYRLVNRDKKLANISLRKMITFLCNPGVSGEFTSMQIACFGPQAVDVLLDTAKTGTEKERALAKESLAFMKDSTSDSHLDPMLVNVVKANQRLLKKVAEKIESEKH